MGGKFFLLSHLSLLWLSIIFPTSSVLASNAAISASQTQKVSLVLYYETLCPYCSNFIVNDLVALFQDDFLSSIVDLKLVPYGNAKIGLNNSISCQHGPYECLLNTVEACAIDAWPQLDEHFPFIHCVETLVYERKYTEWETCFEKLGVDPKPVVECYASGRGEELELQYAAETNALQPPHVYVPWVVVDGQPLYEDYENFISYICKAYKGSTVPQGCSELSSGKSIRRQFNHHPVCYKETAAEMLATRTGSTLVTWMQKIVASI